MKGAEAFSALAASHRAGKRPHSMTPVPRLNSWNPHKVSGGSGSPAIRAQPYHALPSGDEPELTLAKTGGAIVYEGIFFVPSGGNPEQEEGQHLRQFNSLRQPPFLFDPRTPREITKKGGKGAFTSHHEFPHLARPAPMMTPPSHAYYFVIPEDCISYSQCYGYADE